MATVPGPMVEAVSTVHMRASLSAGGTVSFIPTELQAAIVIDMSAFDKFFADFMLTQNPNRTVTVTAATGGFGAA